MEWYIKVIENYVNFSGRAHRTEFWMFILFNIFISIGIGLVEGLVGLGTILGSLYSLFILLPTLAVSVRRLHDSGRSGWWLLLWLIPAIGQLVLLFFYCFDSDEGDNEYGPNPAAG